MSTDVHTDQPTTDIEPVAPATAPIPVVTNVIDPVKTFEPVFEPETIRDPELGLRELTGTDYTNAALWAAITAAATWMAATPFVPLGMHPALLVLGAGLGFLGYLDYVTRLIRNKHVAIFAAVEGLLLIAAQFGMGASVLLPAVIGGACAFVFMLSLTVFTGFAGGGDIKLSAVPAGVLAAFSPLAGMLWLLFTFVLCLVGMIAVRLSRSGAKKTAMGPFMAVAAVLAIVTTGLLNNYLGL